VHTCHPSTQDTEAGRSRVQGQPGYLVRDCQNKNKGKEKKEKRKDFRAKIKSQGETTKIFAKLSEESNVALKAFCQINVSLRI
jgi:hypothetical protein